MITVTGTRENYIAEMTADRGTLNATHCDIPVEQGGDNAYMRPGETLLSALGACMNITARKYLNRDGLDYESVTVKAEMARENGVTKIRTKLEIHGALSQADKDRIIAEVASCPVCEILVRPHRTGKAGLIFPPAPPTALQQKEP